MANIMIVDDDPTIRLLLEAHAREMNHKAVVAVGNACNLLSITSYLVGPCVQVFHRAFS